MFKATYKKKKKMGKIQQKYITFSIKFLYGYNKKLYP